ncbi:hypothetical protein AArcCO_1514 [Halalkaliarchaeum sp. AArc-CO]|uniref:hypothetical protein n=1 Tax=unclassified Halalkaliarchaeum TaxID=2678344 RepID=UPI00217CE9A4|nr:MULTISPECIES: hypothetical protein [unclassified Halalkaliarchaeum]MDR5674099.1 hypothetical protein [Halalkaliarchaeum sp. AArc-GB]UWG50818.1 hypothetical protein AArcCO_1514 [Halalkaliarchaeum sp. AArc-CO]
MDDSTAMLLAAIGGVVTLLTVLAGLVQLPSSLVGPGGIATGITLVITAGVALLIVVAGRQWGGPETVYW